MAEFERRHAAVMAFLDAARTGDRVAYVGSLDALNWRSSWIEVFQGITSLGKVHPETQEIFAEQWFGNPSVFPGHTPEAIAFRTTFFNNIGLLIDGLRILLPPFEGHVPSVIFRGQSILEYDRGIIGMSWTIHPLIAEIYARDPAINKMPCLVLAHFDPGNAIIGSVDVNEIVVDPRLVRKPQVILRPEKLANSGGVGSNLSELHLRELQKFALNAMPPSIDNVLLSLAAEIGSP